MKKLIVLIVIVVIILVAGIAFFNLPQRIGLADTPAEKLLSATPDRETAAAMKADLAGAGVDTSGLEIYVFPIKDSEESLAVVVLDGSAGFDLNSLSEQELTGYLSRVAELDASGDLGIRRVAVDYKNEAGESLLTLTAPTKTIRKFADGEIGREQFLKELEGQVNFTEIAQRLAEAAR